MREGVKRSVAVCGRGRVMTAAAMMVGIRGKGGLINGEKSGWSRRWIGAGAAGELRLSDDEVAGPSLETLPEECLLHVLCQLSVADNAAVAQTSK
eukprot:scaffold104010_cov29-Tisochrysis_lutea.AAC.5